MPLPPSAETYERLIDERLDRARAQLAELTASIADLRATRSLTFADDEHDPEGSTLSLDQARDVALSERTQETVAELSAARQRLTIGRYGSCERCQREIPADRLLARPEARHCVRCASAVGNARR